MAAPFSERRTLPDGGVPVKPQGARLELASLVTLSGLLASLGGAALALRGELWLAWLGLVAAGLADMLDGPIARRAQLSELSKRVGAQLDSLVDAVSFAAAPVILGLCAGLDGPYELPLLAAYALAAIWRLATFDIVGVAEVEGRRVYRGLPVTYSALVLPLCAALALADAELARMALRLAYGLLAAAFLSAWPIPRPGKLGMVGLGLLALALSGAFLMARARGLEAPRSARVEAAWR